MQNRWTGGGRNLGGHFYDRQRCNGKIEGGIPHINYSKISRDGWFVTSFIHMSAKNAKPLQALLECGGEKGGDTYTCMIAVRSACVSFHTVTRLEWLISNFVSSHVPAKNAKPLKP